MWLCLTVTCVSRGYRWPLVETARFRVMNLRPRNKDCAVCGDTPTLKQLVNYTEFCGSAPHDKVRPLPAGLAAAAAAVPDFHISTKDFAHALAVRTAAHLERLP